MLTMLNNPQDSKNTVYNLPYHVPLVDPNTGQLSSTWQRVFAQQIQPSLNRSTTSGPTTVNQTTEVTNNIYATTGGGGGIGGNTGGTGTELSIAPNTLLGRGVNSGFGPAEQITLGRRLWYNDNILNAGGIKTNINDTDYAITTDKDVVICYTALTINRTLQLPPATTSGQRIQIVDESGQCNGNKQIVIVPNTGDTINSDTIANLAFPFATGELQSNGSGKWVITNTLALNMSAGASVLPTATDNGNGTVTLTDGYYNLYSNADGTGRVRVYHIAGGTFTPTNNGISYVVADYNNGTPVVRVISDVTLINETTIVPLISFYREGNMIKYIKWDYLGLALTNKIHQSIVEPYRFIS